MNDRKDKLELGVTKTNNPDILKIQKVLSDSIEAFPILTELAAQVAKDRKMKYDAHIKVGFTPEQALELIK